MMHRRERFSRVLRRYGHLGGADEHSTHALETNAMASMVPLGSGAAPSTVIWRQN